MVSNDSQAQSQEMDFPRMTAKLREAGEKHQSIVSYAIRWTSLARLIFTTTPSWSSSRAFWRSIVWLSRPWTGRPKALNSTRRRFTLFLTAATTMLIRTT
eukprot:2711966-Pleurochrysis_carterae.AAC.4